MSTRRHATQRAVSKTKHGLGLMLVLVSACSAYDAQLLHTSSEDGISTADASTDADSNGSADAAVECSDAEFATCTRPHASTTCNKGECLIAKCMPPYVDCDADAANGCEARLDTPEHCGLCAAECRFSHATGVCRSGKSCAFGECSAGFANCDGDESNGCETSLDSLSDCGGCGTVCTAPSNAVAGCADGTCGIGSCTPPFGDCNGSAADGCEQRLDTDRDCGACGRGCDPQNGAGSCESGSCVVTSCEDGWSDCNGRGSDGCEARGNTVEHCGGCGLRCQLAHANRLACQGEDAGVRCVVDHRCPAEAEGCSDDSTDNGCENGWGDCDGDPANGCETDLTRLSDCGRCDNSCVAANAQGECKNGICAVNDCLPGFARCAGGAECSPLARSADACGECGRQCAGEQPNCAGGRCTGQMCAPDRADCDGNGENGCETNVRSADNCGICGQRCGDLPNAMSTCTSGSCAIDRCAPGFRDCDGEAANGCEVDIRTVNDCGECGRPCTVSEAVSRCDDGQCRIERCIEGRGDCNLQFADGCEADLSLPDNCGSCGTSCQSLPNATSSSCEEDGCELACRPGTADCDGQSANGCEAQLAAATSCGACGNDCTSLAQVRTASCEAGSCKNLVCEPGFADCNGDPADGCERALNTLSDCAACDRPCAPAHGAGNCGSGSCQLDSCDMGWDDCNQSAADGCEAQLSSAEHCGGCNNSCGAGQCTNGQCDCGAGASCGEGSICCDGVCAETKTDCFPWPCLPGLARPGATANCGGCGVSCALLWCCAVP